MKSPPNLKQYTLGAREPGFAAGERKKRIASPSQWQKRLRNGGGCGKSVERKAQSCT